MAGHFVYSNVLLSIGMEYSYSHFHNDAKDDFSSLNKVPVVHATEISESIQDKGIILIDEVLYTGRTIRAAMDALMDLGRPRFIELAVLVDRGGRELPIQADYVGLSHPIQKNEEIQVRFQELDGEESVGVASL